ncbi:GNAT family N-acetyltransferase [Devosia alba]|uniref:GNAT family N-acetyltransferase n=1 Tax=Devosia alba TaxID=3152360 RepID=UPI003263232A
MRTFEKKTDLLSTVADRIWTAWSKDRGLSREQVIRNLESIIASEDEFTLVAHAGREFVGTVSVIASDMVERPDLTPWIADVWVDPEYREHRMGSALVNAAERLAAERGEDVLYLCCVPELRPFYNGLGWTEIESNVGREQACIFEKSMLQKAFVP